MFLDKYALNISSVNGILGAITILIGFNTDGWIDGVSAAEMMKECLDLTDPSNGPLEFAIMRGCIGFQIIKWNSAGNFFSLDIPGPLPGWNNALPDALKCKRMTIVCASKQSVTFELKCKSCDLNYWSPQVSLYITDRFLWKSLLVFFFFFYLFVAGGMHDAWWVTDVSFHAALWPSIPISRQTSALNEYWFMVTYYVWHLVWYTIMKISWCNLTSPDHLPGPLKPQLCQGSRQCFHIWVWGSGQWDSKVESRVRIEWSGQFSNASFEMNIELELSKSFDVDLTYHNLGESDLKASVSGWQKLWSIACQLLVVSI